MRRIIGIDPGSALCGWAVIEAEPGRQGKLVASGCIKTSPKDTTAKRLELLYNELQIVIKKYHPHEGAVEELFFVQNIKTGIVVGQARGAILLALSKAGLPIFEYKPTVVKMALTGYGRAEKKQVQSMVKCILRLEEAIVQDDTADAVAIALCHAQSRTNLNLHSKALEQDAKVSREKEVKKYSSSKNLVYPKLSYEIVGALFDTYKQLGAGLPEKYYYKVFAQKLDERGLKYKGQFKVNIGGLPVSLGRFMLDYLVEDKVVVEIKVGPRILRQNVDQIMNYLRHADIKLGILARFSQGGVDTKRLLLGNNDSTFE